MREHHILLVTTAQTLHPPMLELATRLAARSNAVLLFLHVVPLRREDGEAMLLSAAELGDGRAQGWLDRLAPTAPGVRFRHCLRTGEPEDIIRQIVQALTVDLVLVEEPPRSWLSVALRRGLAERLIRQVGCPVVVGGPEFLGAPGTHRSSQRRDVPSHPAAVADLLNAVVDARVRSLVGWMNRLATAAADVAASETVQTVAAVSSRGIAIDGRLERRLRVELGEHSGALRATGWRLQTAHRSWSSPAAAALRPCPALTDFFERLEVRGTSTSLPVALDDDTERLVVLSGVRVGEGGVLMFAFDAEDDFLRILGQPGPSRSFETYAFDRTGLMLSNSRFPSHLLEVGLLPSEGTQTPLRLRVAEPSDGPLSEWPLTWMAQQATRHRDGVDTRGYRDYRGVLVTGAWRWVPEYGFGITAEVDKASA